RRIFIAQELNKFLAGALVIKADLRPSGALREAIERLIPILAVLVTVTGGRAAERSEDGIGKAPGRNAIVLVNAVIKDEMQRRSVGQADQGADVRVDARVGLVNLRRRIAGQDTV